MAIETPTTISVVEDSVDALERVHMFMGINGVGKTTITDALATEIPRTSVIHASQELRILFGGITREQQERMKLEDKMAEMVMHFTVLFDRGLNDNDRILFDTQLLIPTSNEYGVYYESAWSDEYIRYAGSSFMLVASPDTIKGWRIKDEMRTGRKRSFDIDEIERQQELNIQEFQSLVGRGALPATSHLIENPNGQIDVTKTHIRESIGV